MINRVIITSKVFVAYFNCPRKAFLLLFSGDQGTPHDYPQILEERRKAYTSEYLEIFKQIYEDTKPYNQNNLGKEDFFIEANLKAECWDVHCDVLAKIDQGESIGKVMYEPTIVVGTCTVTKEQRIELFFTGKVLGLIQKQSPKLGRIVSMDGKTHQVKLESGYKSIAPSLKTLQGWIEAKPAEPPDLILNKHCPSCQFQGLCREQAVKEKSLSLLDRMTPKAIQKYNKKGIFNIQQLSYLFKPRKSRKYKGKTPVKHSLELQALAIREQKIYIQKLPELIRNPVELFLDVESIPDQDFHYLIGLLVCNDTDKAYHSFWANTVDDEKEVWGNLIEILNKYPDAPIYHYGNYEVKVINELAKRYSTDCEPIKKRLINLNSYIYGKMYFPTYSNSLKAIGDFIGIAWDAQNASGLQSLVWRYKWENSQDSKYQQMLIRYNQDDCNALLFLANEFCKITASSESQSNIDFSDQPKKIATEIGKQIHEQLDTILKFAHADYDHRKISIRKNDTENNVQTGHGGGRKGHKGYTRKVPAKVNREIHLPILEKCLRCNNDLPNELGKKVATTAITLVFSKDGCRKRICKHIGYKRYCPICQKYCSPLSLLENNRRLSFGHEFKAWIVYQRIILRLPYEIIQQLTEDLFGERISPASISNFLQYFSDYYIETEKNLIQKILKSPFIHADETQINIRGVNQYVWVFTNGTHVIFKLTKTRESDIVHEILAEYQGVLVSDFYGGYDSVNCKQQKCWVHLIRDMNDDLWKTPFDSELESFISEVRNLIVPILEVVEQYGLKKRHLHKFQKNVDKFYLKNVTNKVYHSELVLKYQKRFERYRQSLFTFLEQDSIPWHNNTAENAIRHLAVQRKISGSFFETGATAYLVLLGIMKTCKFQDKSFLEFLLSKEKDIDQFKPRKRKKK